MEKKKYYSRSLEKILNQYVEKSKYGEWTEVLKEILQRRAYEYGFSDEEMEKQTENLVKQLDKIRFATEEEEPKRLSKGPYGIYCTAQKEIILNRDCFEKLKDKHSEKFFYSVMFETVTHEVYHAIVEEEEKPSGLEYITEDGYYEGTVIDEIFTELAADRATFSRTKEDAERYRTETTSYENITFFVNLLAAALGTTEKETLKAGIQDREHLEDFIDKRFPNEEAQELAKDIFQRCEIQLDCLYNMSSDSELDDIEIKKSVLAELYSKIYTMATWQIANDTEAVDSRYTASLLYRYAKMDRIIKDSMMDFEIEPMDRQEILEKCRKEKMCLYQQVNSIDELEKQSYKFASIRDKEEWIGYAKMGYINDVVLSKLYDITIPETMDFSVDDKTRDMTYYTYVIEEDYDLGRGWDNDKIVNWMKSLFEREKEENLGATGEVENSTKDGFFSQILNALKEMARRIKNSGQKKLPSAQTRTSVREDGRADNPWKVSKEELIPLDVVRQNQNFYKEKSEKDREN